MIPDEQTLAHCLEKYFQARLQEIPETESGSSNPGSGESEEMQREASRKRGERYQYAIWRIKDRLSYGIFGRASEKLADDFLARFGLEVEKRSEEYYRVLRRVLQAEMDSYAALMRLERGDPNDIRQYYQRQMQARRGPFS